MTRRKLRYVSSATILDVLVAEPDGITVTDLARIVYPDSVGTGTYSEALSIIGDKLADCVSDDMVEPIGFRQGKVRYCLTDRGRAVYNKIKEARP